MLHNSFFQQQAEIIINPTIRLIRSLNQKYLPSIEIRLTPHKKNIFDHH
jgi:hypothetical protein